MLPNEKMMIEDAAFNAENSLVGRNTTFRKNIIKLVEARKEMPGYDFANHEISIEGEFDIEKLVEHEKHLYNAEWEMVRHSNFEESKGLQVRRDAEGALGNSYRFKEIKCAPHYIKKAAQDSGRSVLRNISEAAPNPKSIMLEAREVGKVNAMVQSNQILEIFGFKPGFNDTLMVNKISVVISGEYINNTEEIINSVQQKIDDKIDKLSQDGLSKKEIITGAKFESVKFGGRHLRMRNGLLKKMNAILTGIRQQSVGVTHYVWRTCQDNAVRDSHRDREGRVFSWQERPMGGHPGEDYNCRCEAEPSRPESLIRDVA